MLFDALCCFVESVECYSKTWRLDRLPGRGSCNLLEIVNILNFRVEVSSVFIETVLFFQNLSQTQECHLAFPLFSHLFNFVQRSLVQTVTSSAMPHNVCNPGGAGYSADLQQSSCCHDSSTGISWTPKIRCIANWFLISQSQLCQVLCWKWFSMMKLDLEIFDLQNGRFWCFFFKLILHCQSFGFGSHLT